MFLIFQEHWNVSKPPKLPPSEDNRKEGPTKSASTISQAKAVKKMSLFEEEDEEDLFAITKERWKSFGRKRECFFRTIQHCPQNLTESDNNIECCLLLVLLRRKWRCLSGLGWALSPLLCLWWIAFLPTTELGNPFSCLWYLLILSSLHKKAVRMRGVVVLLLTRWGNIVLDLRPHPANEVIRKQMQCMGPETFALIFNFSLPHLQPKKATEGITAVWRWCC